MTIRKLYLAAALLVTTGPVMADAVGVRISGGMFDYEATGTVRDSADPGDTIDIKSTLGVQDDTEFLGYAYIEHPVPVLPNIRLGTTSMKLAGTGNTGGGFDFNGVTFPGAQSLTSSADLSHTEIGLYYELIDVGFDLDLGINVKFFDGSISLTSNGTTTSDTFDETVPMLYAGINIPLVGGFSLTGDISTLAVNDSDITDYFVRLRYVTDFMLGAELGYRSFSLDFEDTDANEYADVEVSGPYLAVHLAF